MRLPFLVIGLPRSRTAWLANYLTVGDSLCIHEPVQYGASKLYEELTQKNISFSSSEFLIWTSTIDSWNRAGVMNVLLIERDYEQAVESFCKVTGTGKSNRLLPSLKVNLDYLKENLLNSLIIPYNEIDSRIKEIHEYLIPHIPFNAARAEMLCNLRVTQITDKVLKNYASYSKDNG